MGYAKRKIVRPATDTLMPESKVLEIMHDVCEPMVRAAVLKVARQMVYMSGCACSDGVADGLLKGGNVDTMAKGVADYSRKRALELDEYKRRITEIGKLINTPLLQKLLKTGEIDD